MRHLVTLILCLGLLLSAAYSQALSPLRLTVVAQDSAPDPRDPAPAEPERSEFSHVSSHAHEPGRCHMSNIGFGGTNE